jgi:hypothetical protein
MNANTILSFRAGTGRNQLASLALSSTTATAATCNTDTVGSPATAILRVPTQSAILGSFNPQAPNVNSALTGPAYGRLFGTPRGNQAPYFTTSDFDGVPFRIRVHGIANLGANAAQSALVQLTLGTSSTLGSNVIIANTGAALAGVAGGAVVFSIVAEIVWTAGSGANGNIAGRFSSTISFLPTPTAQVVSDVILSNVTAPAAAVANLAFVPFFTLGNGAASTVQFNEFALELA